MTEKAINIIQKEFVKIRKSKVPDQELRKAKESIKGNLILSLENTSNRMIRMAQSELYFNKIKTTEEVIKQIDAVTTGDILEIANELLDENSLMQIIIKSKNGLLVRQKRTAA
jgi:predicted Zn-dependent peptidase